MKKTILLMSIIIVGCFSHSYAEAKNYYAAAIYEITGKSGKTFAMNVITKTYDETACRATINLNPKIQGKWILSGTECVTGVEYDSNFSATFNAEALTVSVRIIEKLSLPVRTNKSSVLRIFFNKPVISFNARLPISSP